MFKGLGDLASLMKHAQQIGQQMNSMSADLRDKKVTGSAGGGMVEVDMNGHSEPLAVRIDAGLLAQQDKELLEDLVLGAIRDAQDKAKELHMDSVKSLSSGLNVPGVDEALSKLMGGMNR